MKIAIIGTGYVGTVAGACFAESGNSVICVDRDQEKVRRLCSGDPVIFEPGLQELLQRNIAARRIAFTTSIRDAVDQADLVFMTVGTPSLPSGDADLSFLEAATRETARILRSPKVIVTKSTVPVGTHRKVAKWVSEETNLPVEVVSNPEFLREGAAVQDFLNPERVVIGTTSDRAFQVLGSLYRPFVGTSGVILQMDPVSSELTKYACNAMLATRISFMNEMARLCDRLGADIESVRQGMAEDSRIGRHFLNAGIGYGGSCFPKDIRAIIATGDQVGIPLRLMRAVEDINETQKSYLMERLQEEWGARLRGKVVAIWGLAFKPETDDVREAPALVLIRGLLQAGARVRVYDPVALENTRAVFAKLVEFCEDPGAAVEGADALMIATEWTEFRNFDLSRLRSLLAGRLVLDGRNIYDPIRMRAAGFIYRAVGRSANQEKPASDKVSRLESEFVSA